MKLNMNFGTVDFCGDKYVVHGEVLNIFIHPNRMNEIMAMVIEWVASQNVLKLADSSQIQVFEGDMIHCRIHENLGPLNEKLQNYISVDYVDFELDPQLMLIHIRLHVF